jgi:hypothetical protein
LNRASLKTPLPRREGIKGRGIKKVIMHPHPSPLPSRERGNWIELISFFGFKVHLTPN